MTTDEAVKIVTENDLLTTEQKGQLESLLRGNTVKCHVCGDTKGWFRGYNWVPCSICATKEKR
jgi:predicted deacetylase